MWKEFQYKWKAYQQRKTCGALVNARVVLILLGLVAIATMLVSLYGLYVSYTQYPVQTVVKVIPTGHLAFPAVTICNINSLEMSKLKAQDSPTYNVPAALVALSLWRSGLKRDINASELNNTIPFVINSTLLNATFLDISRQAFSDLHSTLVHCSWDGKKEDCADMFRPLEMGVHRCFQFNGHTPDEAPRRESRISGLNSGLGVIVNVRQEEYFFNEAAKMSAGAQYHYLPAPFQAFGKEACVNEVDCTSLHHHIFPNVTYTHALCRRLCVDGLTQRHCGCRISNVSYSFDSDLPLCTVKDAFTCYFPTYDNLTKWHNNAECSCPRLCHLTEYDVTTSTAYFPSLAAQDIFHGLDFMSKHYIRRNVFVLKVFYDELLYYEIAHVPQHTVLSVIGTIGGQMGLFIGASLLSLVELLHLLLTLCVQAARAVYSKPQRRKNSTVSLKENRRDVISILEPHDVITILEQ